MIFELPVSLYQNYSLYIKLLELYNENPFRIKNFERAEDLIKKIGNIETWQEFKTLCIQHQYSDSLIAKLEEFYHKGTCSELESLLQKTPKGIFSLLKIRGIGPKKIKTLWDKLAIENADMLYQACIENKLVAIKGFGKTTQENIKDRIAFYQKNRKKVLLNKGLQIAELIQSKLKEQFPTIETWLAGDLALNLDVIENIKIISSISNNLIEDWLCQHNINIISKHENSFSCEIEPYQIMLFFYEKEVDVNKQIFNVSASAEFIQQFKEANLNIEDCPLPKADQIYYISLIKENKLTPPIHFKDIKGLIHCHSNWSDGVFSIEDMATYCIQIGFEYMLLTDHSQSAVYANGLSIDRVYQQHLLIDQLNKKYAPFKIFKGIEADILIDGRLDYEDDILRLFDGVVASVHNQLELDQHISTERVLKALSNKYTKFLGHSCGRLLLERKGFSLQYDKIFSYCSQHQIAIEINANPKRLDLDWRLVNQALEQGVQLSINPDAHSIEGIMDIKYGLLIAEKTRLTIQNNISSFNLVQFEQWLKEPII